MRDILEGKSKIETSKKYLQQEVENILQACNQIGRNIKTPKYGSINKDLLCELNKIVLLNIPTEKDVEPGIYRNHRVGVGRYCASGCFGCT